VGESVTCNANCTVKAVLAVGTYQTCAILPSGSLKCWSAAKYPEDMGDNLPPIDLGDGLAILLVAVGGHVCAILDSSELKCWGDNEYGQLGVGDNQDSEPAPDLPPVDLGQGRTAVQVGAGRYHTCAVLDDASVKCWGRNDYGQLGLGDTSDRGDAAGEMGDNLGAVSLGTDRFAIAVVAGAYHSCAVLDDGSLKCWGYNAYGQLCRMRWSALIKRICETDPLCCPPEERGAARMAGRAARNEW